MATYGKTDFRAMKDDLVFGKLDNEYILAPGKHFLRFLPPWTEEHKVFYFRYFVHYINRVPYVCSQNTWNTSERCPICTFQDHLYHSRDPEEVGRAREFYRVLAFIAQVVDTKKPQDGVQVVRFGIKILKQLKAFFGTEDDGDMQGVDITDPDQGHTVKIEVIPPPSPNAFKEYICAMDPRPSPVPLKGWDRKLVDLEAIVKKLAKPASELKTIISSYTDTADSYGERDEPRSSSRSTREFDNDDDVPDSWTKSGSANDDDDFGPGRAAESGGDDDDFAPPPASSKRDRQARQPEEEEEVQPARGRGRPAQRSEDDEPSYRPAQRSSGGGRARR